ncbi:MAG: glycine cleavage system aminomethyltransferase GcvT [Synechococcales bacterium]|nr:glycine cleavage system aminomethyltransferase GcvT [Synechococcales bacterium]
MKLDQTPLYHEIITLNPRMTNFAGWEMPLQFTGISQEHQQVRSKAGMFDISHMGKFLFQGVGVMEALQFLVPSDLSRLQPGQSQYTVLLNPEGGIIDDLIIYYLGQTITDLGLGERVIVIVNASTRRTDWEWFAKQFEHRSSPITTQDLTHDQVLLAVQGPDAVDYLQTFTKEDLGSIPRFGHLEGMVMGQSAFLARTGYTGEDGFEVMAPPDLGVKLWRSLHKAGVYPCGLGARDTLRLEAAMALYGQDMDGVTTPIEAGLRWLVHLDRKADFIGRSALAAQILHGEPRRLVGLVMEGRTIARHGYGVFHHGEKIGEVTSGTWSPTLEKAIALAYVPPTLANPGQKLHVNIRGKDYGGTVVKKPFYQRMTYHSKPQ